MKKYIKKIATILIFTCVIQFLNLSLYPFYKGEKVLADTLPIAVTNISATPSYTKVNLSWNAVSGATGYDVEVDGIVIDNGTSTTYTHSNLTVNSQHSYRVRAKNSGGNGNWSDAISKTTLAPMPTYITVDGDSSDWAGIAPTATGSGTTTALYTLQDSNNLYLLIKGTNIGQWNDFYIDSDNNESTGEHNWNWTN